MSEWIGQTLSKVKIESIIGRGGMAEVYLGHHTTLQRPMAVKILHAHMSEDKELRTRFRAEAQSVASLRHPNIVQVFDFDVVDGRPYIVMELLEGMTLADYLRALHRMGTILPLDRVVHLIAGIASALDYAHARGIIHRDVKPANVVLRQGSIPIQPGLPLARDVEPVLTDFGVAHIATATTHTASGTILGTPAYMSPEQVRGEPIDARTDIYSLGVILYEMLSGAPPFDTETDTPASVLYKQVHEKPPPLADVPPNLQAIVDKALAKDRSMRFQHVDELARDLETALFAPDQMTIARPAASSPSESTVTTPPAVEEEIPTPSSISPVKEPSRGPLGLPRPLIFAALGLGAIVLAGGVFLSARLLDDFSVSGKPLTTAPIAKGTTAGSTMTSPTTATAPAAVEPNLEPTVDTLTPRGLVQFHDSGLTAAVESIDPAPEGQVYVAWLTGGDATETLNLNQAGAVVAEDDRLVIGYQDPSEANLLTRFDRLVISLEGADSPSTAPGGIVYEAVIPSEMLVRVRTLYDRSPNDPLSKSLLEGMSKQAVFVNDHLNFTVKELESRNLPGAITHAEHVINLIVGEEDANYHDYNGDDRIETPGGDLFGLLPYLNTLKETLHAMKVSPATPLEMENSIEDITTEIEIALIPSVEDIRDIALGIAGADTIGSIDTLDLGGQLKGHGQIQEEVRALAAQVEENGLEQALAVTVDVFAVSPAR